MFFLKKSLIITALAWLSCFLALTSVGNANNSSRNYNSPPSEKIAQRRSVGSGSRSPSCQSLFPKDSLTLLVPPAEIVHYTTSSNPSFYLYAQVSSTIPLIFNLIIPDPKANNPLVENTLIIEQPGLYELKLPPEVELKTNIVYFLQLGIPCSNAPQKIAQVLKAAVKRVPVSAQLSNQLELANSHLERAKIYANSGIWYDSLMWAKKEPYSPESVDFTKKLAKEIEINLEEGYVSTSKFRLHN